MASALSLGSSRGDLQPLFDRRHLLLQFGELRLRHLAHLAVGIRVGDQFREIAGLALRRPQLADRGDDGFHVGIFLGQLAEFRGVVANAFRELLLQLRVALQHPVQAFLKTHGGSSKLTWVFGNIVCHPGQAKRRAGIHTLS